MEVLAYRAETFCRQGPFEKAAKFLLSSDWIAHNNSPALLEDQMEPASLKKFLPVNLSEFWSRHALKYPLIKRRTSSTST